MLEVGSVAPDFETVDSAGRTFRSSDLRGHPAILYFFPKAFTGGCTMETKGFAALTPSLVDRDVRVVGISVDTAETQARFALECRANFPILADPSKSIARRFGVLSLLGVSKRVTFFLDGEGVVRDVVASLLPGPHLARARARYLSSG